MTSTSLGLRHLAFAALLALADRCSGDSFAAFARASLASLGPTPDHNDPIRAALAQRIIALAKAGESDAERLCDGALQAVSPADPSGGRGHPEGET